MFGFRALGQDKLPLPAGPNHCLLTAWLACAPRPPPRAWDLASPKASAVLPARCRGHQQAKVAATCETTGGQWMSPLQRWALGCFPAC